MRTRQAAVFSIALSSLLAVNATAFAELDPGVTKSSCIEASPEPSARIVAAVDVRGVRDFDFADLRVEYAPNSQIVLEGPADAIANLSVVIDDGLVSIERGDCVVITDGIRVTIAAPSFELIEARGASVSSARGIRSATDLTVDIDGDGDSHLEMRAAGEVVVFTDGAGTHAMDVIASSLVALHTGSGALTIGGRASAASVAEFGTGLLSTHSLFSGELYALLEGREQAVSTN